MVVRISKCHRGVEEKGFMHEILSFEQVFPDRYLRKRSWQQEVGGQQFHNWSSNTSRSAFENSPHSLLLSNCSRPFPPELCALAALGLLARVSESGQQQTNVSTLALLHLLPCEPLVPSCMEYRPRSRSHSNGIHTPRHIQPTSHPTGSMRKQTSSRAPNIR